MERKKPNGLNRKPNTISLGLSPEDRAQIDYILAQVALSAEQADAISSRILLLGP